MGKQDRDRILFLTKRDPSTVMAFVEQAKSQYRRAALNSKSKYGRGGNYRRLYAQSYLFHKRLKKQSKFSHKPTG